MENLNLLLRFTTPGDAETHVKAATRITLDGLGGLLVYNSATGIAERISLSELGSLRIDRAPNMVAAPSWIN